MDKRYQVFVSSTFEDLQDERKEVIQVLLESNCIPAGMELFQASDDDQWTLIKNVIDDCDYYLVIIGGRYGSTNKDGISYTQMEYEYALKKGKPILAFLHKDPGKIIADKTEKVPENKKKLEAFRELAEKKVVRYWDTPENLGGLVSRSIHSIIKSHPAIGWVKADSIVDEKSVAEISRLQKANEELKTKLKEISTEAPKGSEELSQGEDMLYVEYSVIADFLIDDVYDEKEVYLYDYFTWNQLFSVVAPSIIIERNEDDVIELFNAYLRDDNKGGNRRISKTLDDGREVYSESISDFKITQKSFDKIKIQLKALGLIDFVFVDNETYWKLTPYGDYMMTKLLAVKKQ